jgi:hypothetical protein
VGSSPVWDVERMRAVAGEWDAALRAVLPAYARLVPEAEARGSVLRVGAAEVDVVAAERRLDVTLPPSYRSFLLLSDGADAGVLGADRVERFYGEHRSAFCGVGSLRPLSDHVDWLVPQWLEAFADVADQQKPPSADGPSQVFDFAPGLSALALTEPQQDGTLALVPFPGEWQVWDFQHSEVTGYVSFAQYLRDQARRAWSQVAERDARARTALTDGSSFADATALAEAGDPRAVGAACRVLARGDDRAVPLLIKLGDPEAIPTLRAAYADASTQQLRVMLVWALQSCGDRWIVEELSRLVDLAAQPEAKWAASMLETHDQVVRW